MSYFFVCIIQNHLLCVKKQKPLNNPGLICVYDTNVYQAQLTLRKLNPSVLILTAVQPQILQFPVGPFGYCSVQGQVRNTVMSGSTACCYTCVGPDESDIYVKSDRKSMAQVYIMLQKKSSQNKIP